MSSSPILVSILMPVRDAEPYLVACLDSIVAQSFKEWELIAIDDHSSDNSWGILQDYFNKDIRIKVFQNDGSGIIDALRLAYTQAQGDLITRMDADDLMDPDKLRVLRNHLIVHGQGHISIGAVKYFSEDTLGDGYKRYESWLNSLTATGNNFDELYRECVIPSPCWMLWREDLEQAGAFDDDVYPEDYDLAFRMYQSGLEVIPCRQAIHLWRDHPNRSSRTDDNYADNRFIQLKCKHFVLHDYDESRPTIIWGAGKKGKSIVQLLRKEIDGLNWITDNEKKIGKDIYGITLRSSAELMDLDLPQVIVAVANPEERQEIESSLIAKGLFTMIDYFMFC